MTMPIESQESSSPIVTRAVAAGLRGEFTETLRLPAWQKALLLGLGVLPQRVARFAISRFQSISGLPPAVLQDFSIESLLQARLGDYASLPGKFPAVTLGAALGGATSALSLALGAPFLPQAFVTTLRGGSPDGNPERYLQLTLGRALEIAERNPGLMTIQHFDPVHDGWLTQRVNHLRFKLLDLPAAYAEFLRARLQAGGTVVYLEGGAQWLRYRVGPRSVFQVGGWGDIPDGEFLQGSPRLHAYAARAGMQTARWSLDETRWPLERGPESEWGSEPGLGEALQAFCQAQGFRFLRLHLPQPEDFSRLAFFAMRKLMAKEGRTPAGVVVEVFSQFDTQAARLGGLLPLWLIFNTHDSARYLKEMSAHFPAGLPVFFSPLATFSETPDLASWEEWQEAIGRDFINIGARRSHYPADARALVRWNEPLRAWVARNARPLPGRLTPDELREIWDNLPSS